MLNSIAHPKKKIQNWALHIHGSLAEHAIMGIDNYEQIANPDFRSDNRLAKTIVKQ
jgi:hypothetical protein